jgi:biotin synthase
MDTASYNESPAVAADSARIVERWSAQQVETLFDSPFNDLLYRAHSVHRSHFDPNAVQLSTLLSVKTGGCPEDCGYCPQAARYHTGVANEDMLSVEQVTAAARLAKANGATRFCMGAAWRGPRQRELERVAEMVQAVRAEGLETCATLGLLKEGQAEQLKAAGLDYYNHNIDTAPEFYGEIITTRTQDDRLQTLARVRRAGIHVCCGGIVGMGEARRTRAALIAQLASMDPYPESVPINNLVQVEGTPLHGTSEPKAMVRLSAGRQAMPEAVQALCFFAGANSIFYGEKLLTTGNPDVEQDQALFEKLGLRPLQ